MKRVIAIESFKNNVCRLYGEGVYIGDKEPSEGFLKDTGIKNPCIKLDSGKYIWGYQCWWIDIDTFNEKYKSYAHDFVTVEIDEDIKPKE